MAEQPHSDGPIIESYLQDRIGIQRDIERQFPCCRNADDIVHEAFLRTIEKVREGMKIENIGAYVRTAAIRLVLNALNMDRTKRDGEPDLERCVTLMAQVVFDDPFERVSERERFEALRDAFATLTAREREIFFERYRGVPFKAIAQRLGISIQRVAQIQDAVIKQLEERINGRA